MKKGLTRGLTPPLARQGPQGVVARPPDRIVRDHTIMPMRPVGPTPSGDPSATPRPKSGK